MTKEEISKEFEIELSELNDIEILYQDLDHDQCGGSTLIIFNKKEKLYGVWASHCSCGGFEGQWKPEEISEEFLNSNHFPSYVQKILRENFNEKKDNKNKKDRIGTI